MVPTYALVSLEGSKLRIKESDEFMKDHDHETEVETRQSRA